MSATDGPFAETKELIGGYFLIEAKDRAEAVRVAARIPGARIGLAVDLGPSGIRVNSLRPHAIPQAAAKGSHSRDVFRPVAERAGSP